MFLDNLKINLISLLFCICEVILPWWQEVPSLLISIDDYECGEDKVRLDVSLQFQLAQLELSTAKPSSEDFKKPDSDSMSQEDP